MKFFKLFFLFFIINFFLGCTNRLKENNISSKLEPNSNFGRFLSTRYSLKVGDNDVASKLISKSKNLHLDFTLAELNFKSYLINGDFYKAKKFKLMAPNGLKELPMYDLPDFIMNLKNGNFLKSNNFNTSINKLPGFQVVFQKLNYMKLVESENIKEIDINLDNSNIFNLLIFENTKIEKQVYSKMEKTNLSLIENILYLGYLKRKNPKKFDKKINNFSLKFNYDVNTLNAYFEDKPYIKMKPSNQFILANLFSYISFLLSSQKNLPNSYLKILNEISHYLEPTLGNSNYFLAQIYANEKNFQIALNKLNRIKENSFMFLYSKIKKYRILKTIDKNKSSMLLKSMQKEYPNNSEILSLIANNYRNQNKCIKAIKIYDQLIEKNINKTNYYYLKAICLDKLDKWKESRKILLQLISKNPNDAYVLNYLSYSMAIRNEDLIEAKKLIIRALRIERNNGFFLDTLGWIQFKQGYEDKAVRTIQKAIELEPNNSEIIDHLGDIYYKIGRVKEAIYEWNRALDGNADDKLKEEIKYKLKKHSK
ncbi:tetratricopeptide repeat protein [Alphaproteobacteria bacterium]|nr:tetratricopeptide repeat protein [Alphaproteobacteria bacterium]